MAQGSLHLAIEIGDPFAVAGEVEGRRIVEAETTAGKLCEPICESIDREVGQVVGGQ